MSARLAALTDRMRRIALQRARPADAPAPTARQWYTIRNADDADRAVVQLDGEIGWDVQSSTFLAELRGVTAPNIDLQINSGGGSVWDGYAIYNALVSHPAKVTAHVLGLAASAASFIAMSGDEIIAYRPSEMMIHDAAGWIDVFGYVNPAELAKLAEDINELKLSLDQTSDEIAAIYARKAGGTAAEWRGRMSATTWYTPDAALAAGLVDRIAGEDTATETEESPAPGADGASNTIDRFRARARANLVRARARQNPLLRGVS